jgi:hypothetical protein
MMLFMAAELFSKADEGVHGSRNVLESGGHEGLARGVARGGRSCSERHNHRNSLSYTESSMHTQEFHPMLAFTICLKRC